MIEPIWKRSKSLESANLKK